MNRYIDAAVIVSMTCIGFGLVGAFLQQNFGAILIAGAILLAGVFISKKVEELKKN
jgi:hypothetical protein